MQRLEGAAEQHAFGLWYPEYISGVHIEIVYVLGLVLEDLTKCGFTRHDVSVEIQRQRLQKPQKLLIPFPPNKI